MPELKALEELPGSLSSLFDNVQLEDGLERSRTRSLCAQTNSLAVAKMLNQVCGETTPCVRRHVRLIGGVAKQAQVYPEAMISDLCIGHGGWQERSRSASSQGNNYRRSSCLQLLHQLKFLFALFNVVDAVQRPCKRSKTWFLGCEQSSFHGRC